MVYVRRQVPLHDVDDVAYRVFESLYEAIRTSNAPDGSKPASFFAFLRTIAKRRVVDYRRGRRSLPEAALREVAALRAAASEPPDEFEPRELAAVEECLDGLDEEPFHLVVSYFYRGISTRAIETQTGTPASTVRMRIARALQRLRDCLRSHGIAVDSVPGSAIVG
jgi:RNA polymerase sigma factor (sigma-70 family)